MGNTDVILYETDGYVAIITLNRTEALNAFDAELRSGFRSAQLKAEADDNIRIVVLTGAGRAFSSGTDLKEMPEMAAKSGMFDNSIRDYKPLIDGIAKSEKVYIAAINGFAGGVALGLALGSDLAVMAEDAMVFSPFANIGFVPDGGSSWQFLRTMGYKRAFAAIAECERLDANTCLELGFVNKVVASEKLLDETLSWAHSLAKRAPLSLRYTKKILRQAATMSREETARLESEYQMIVANSEDSKSAIQAFAKKQKPVFKGH